MGRGSDQTDPIDLSAPERMAVWDEPQIVLVQLWIEKERGWGQRPDGYSIHLGKEDRDTYIKAVYATMPEEAPDEYSDVMGEPYQAHVDKPTFLQLLEADNGLRFYSNAYPAKIEQ